jgi:hypothetical protein
MRSSPEELYKWRPVRSLVALENENGHCHGIAFSLSASRIRLRVQPGFAQLTQGDPLTLTILPPFSSTPPFTCHVVDECCAIDARGFNTSVFEVTCGATDAEKLQSIRDASESTTPAVVLLGFPVDLAQYLPQRTRTIVTDSAEQALESLGRLEVGCLATGPLLPPADACNLLRRSAALFPQSITVNVVLGAGSDFAIFQDLVDEDRLYYLARRGLTHGQAGAIVASALARYLDSFELRVLAEMQVDATAISRVLELCRQLQVQVDETRVSRLLADAARVASHSERAYCLVYEWATDTLSSGDLAAGDTIRLSASSGLASYIAKTGEEKILLDFVGADPRYDADTDNPGGTGDERFIAEPIRAFDGTVLAILVGLRGAGSPPYGAQDEEALRFASQLGAATLNQMLLRQKVEALLAGRATPSSRIFRQEALDHHGMRWTALGDILRGTPAWLKGAYWLVVGVLLAGLALLCTSTVDEYTTGPAIIRNQNKVAVSAPVSGTIVALDVAAGEHVKAGDRIAVLRSPVWPAGQAVRAAAQEVIRAPTSGVVTETLVRSTRSVTKSDRLVTILGEPPRYEMLAFVPAYSVPQLVTGEPIALRLRSLSNSPVALRVASVAADTPGPDSAVRYLGDSQRARLPAVGPVLIVRAALEGTTIRVDGGSYPLYDGLEGEAEIRTGKVRVLFVLLPRLGEHLHQK